MPDDIRLGLLGCGRIARMVHLDVMRSLGSTRLVAVADPDGSARAAALALAPGVRQVAQWEDALDPSDIDAVVICLPNALHAEAAVAAFEMGIAVYVEKPLALDPAQGRRVVDAWRAAGTVGMVGFNFRYSPVMRQLRAAVADRRAGRLVSVRTVVCSPPRALPGWKMTRSTGGGALLDLAIHHIDLVRYVLDDEVVEVAAAVRSVRTEDDTAVLQMRMASGLPVQTLASLTARQTDRVEVVGDEATLVGDRFSQPMIAMLPATSPTSRRQRLAAGAALVTSTLPRLRTVAAPGPEPSFTYALRAYRTAVLRRWPVRPDPVDGLRALEVVAAAEEAARRGAAVAVAAA